MDFGYLHREISKCSSFFGIRKVEIVRGTAIAWQDTLALSELILSLRLCSYPNCLVKSRDLVRSLLENRVSDQVLKVFKNQLDGFVLSDVYFLGYQVVLRVEMLSEDCRFLCLLELLDQQVAWARCYVLLDQGLVVHEIFNEDVVEALDGLDVLEGHEPVLQRPVLSQEADD